MNVTSGQELCCQSRTRSQSTSAAPALEMTLLVGPNFNLPPSNIRSVYLYSRWPRPSINYYDIPSQAVYTSIGRFAVH
jgi:hypothetical protein